MSFKNIALVVARYLLYAFVVRCVLIYSYRLIYHPCHSYPGPFTAKFTDWYGAFHAFFRRLHLVTYRDHQKYGTAIRHGPNKLVFNSVTALHDIYQSERLYKSRSYLVTQPVAGVYNLFNVLDKRSHRIKRRIIGQGINDRSARQFEPDMIKHVDIFIQQLLNSSGKTGAAVNMTKRCKYLGIDVIGQLGFGSTLDLQTDSKNHFVLKGLETSNFRSNLYIQFPLLKKVGMELLLYPFILTRQMKYYTLIRDLVLARRSQGKHARKDLYSFIADLKDPETGEGMRLRNLWSEAAFFIPADQCHQILSPMGLATTRNRRTNTSTGGDTTSTALSATFFYLSRYPECYKKLAKEIRSTFSDGTDIKSSPALAGCSYLRACIDESLRMTPPISTTLWRELPADDKEPFLVDGHVIPPGTQLGVNMYAIHHNEAYFPNLFTFQPERWLFPDESHMDEEAKLAKRRMYDAFSPFSIGSRGCAGKAMAYMEISLALAKTLWYLDFERPSGKEDKVGEGIPGNRHGRGRKLEFQGKDQFGSLHDGPFLVFRPRADVQKELDDLSRLESLVDG
ncbi:cytochrome P450 [Mollisia scopiformis]|uniref:Cytochrome P450 n=1 Tax=Mollisia scopiformis TaxID=149040 RepID=A0A194WU12_MOLSC|nr:cytochrome P450 [Mollisia scopiformis]KUJ11448.1 cytochrome P450 [Mollisia scopiformis]